MAFTRTLKFLSLIGFLSLPLLSSACARAQQDFFRIEQRDGIWWFVDSSGKPALSIGVDHIAYEPDRIRGTGGCPYREAVEKIYPDRNTWGLAILARIRAWGFNTIGTWSDADLWNREMPYTPILDIAAQAGADWWKGKPLDVYDPRFEQTARSIAETVCAPRRDDHFLLGYFSDNELRWGPDWRGNETMLEMYLKLSADAPGRQQAVEFLRRRYRDDIGKLNQAWGASVTGFDKVSGPSPTDTFQEDTQQFLEKVATRYFAVCVKAIRTADPNHLFLGARFAGRVPDAVLRSARVADVVSVNIYDSDPRPLVQHIYQVTGRPVLITEFAFRAEDSGLPNTHGPGPVVLNQQARAKAYANYVTWLESLPEAVGYHWFKCVDEPKEGRFDGEDSNYGLVDINDRPYQEFVEAVQKANAAATEAHKKSGR
jgi:hypothetical protein